MDLIVRSSEDYPESDHKKVLKTLFLDAKNQQRSLLIPFHNNCSVLFMQMQKIYILRYFNIIEKHQRILKQLSSFDLLICSCISNQAIW